MSTQPVLTLSALTKTDGTGMQAVHALRGVDLQLTPGELVVAMGPPGFGKSTLQRLAHGLDTPTSGTVEVAGVDLAGANSGERGRLRREVIGYVFQEFNLINALTAAGNVAAPLELDGVPQRRARQAALASLAAMGLANVADRYPDEMSGEQQQRVAIARALVGLRRLVLADGLRQ